MNTMELLEDRRLMAVDPANFVNHVTNPYMPLLPGTIYVYKGVQDGKPALNISRNTLSPALQRSSDMTTPSSTVRSTASGVASWPK